MKKSFSLLFLNEEELNVNQATHLHVYDKDGKHEMKENALLLNAPISMTLPIKLSELAKKSKDGVLVTIVNNDKKRRYDRDLTEESFTLRFEKEDTSENLALRFASIQKCLAEVRRGRAITFIVKWEE